jgi:hypothetical protein
MQSLQNVYDAIASTTFDSSGVGASSNGSLLQILKFVSNSLFFASSSGNVSLSSGNFNISAGGLLLNNTTRIDNLGQGTFTTTTISSLTVSGTSTFTGTAAHQGLTFTTAIGTSISLSASSTIAGLNFTNATGTTLFATSVTSTNLKTTNFTLGAVNGLLQSQAGVVGAAASNQYVSSTAAGAGITVNATTGAITVTNNGVLSLANGGNINISSATGTVTLSLNPSISTSTITTATTTNLNFTNATGSNISVSGSSTIALLNFSSATGTTGLITNFTGTNLNFTAATGTTALVTNLTGTNLNFTAATGSSLSLSASSTIASLNFVNATGTTALITNLTGTNLNFTSATGTSISLSGSSTIANLNFINATGTTALITNLTGTNLNFTTGTGTSLSLSASSTVANLNFVNATGTTALITNLTGTNLNFTSATGSSLSLSASSTIASLNFINATGTNLTVNTISASGAMTIGSLAQTLTLQGSSTNIVATSTNAITFTAGGAERMRIASSSFVGIGTTTPQYGLVLGDGVTQRDLLIPKGFLCVDSNNSGCPAAGTASSGQIYASATAISAIDLAENYPTNDPTLEAGDLVSLDIHNAVTIVRASRDNATQLFGVISTAPGVLLGRKVENARPVALTGRVPMKVSSENGPIHINDAITISSIPGVGMKGTSTQIVGYALEDWSGTGTGSIVGFVRLGDVRDETSFASTVQGALSKVGLWIDQGILKVKEVFADIIHAKRVQTEEIEMTDSATGGMYCIRITNGDWQKTAGSCDSPAPAAPSAPSDPTPPPAPETSDSTTISP